MREVWSAPAKINLSLKITGKREDGYHTVDTVYQAIDLTDTVTLEPQTGDDDVTCVVTGPMAEGVPEGDENLAARAARLIAERTGHDVRVAITIEKRIPAGAGLGGGSSDAAAVLMALGKRYAVPDPEHTLVELAAELGADVPFFLSGGTQRGTGIGDVLEPVEPPPASWGIVVWPCVRVSTKWAFQAYDSSSTSPEEANAFEPLVVARHPEVGLALDTLRDGAAIAGLSGTGSAVFALYEERAQRDRELERASDTLSGERAVSIWRCALLSRGVSLR